MHQQQLTFECTFPNAHSRKEISLYSIGSEKPKQVGRKKTSDHYFKMTMSESSSQYFYVVVKILDDPKKNLSYIAVYNGDSNFVAISERSTVATLFCFAQFVKIDPKRVVSISGKESTIAICYGMKNNFIYESGNISKVISSAPNGLVTNSWALFNFIGNLLFYSAKNQSIYNSFLRISSGLSQSNSTIQALFHLIKHPFENVRGIYDLIDKKKQVFQPSLPDLKLPKGHSRIPNQWTLTIKVNDSGSKNFLISGPGYITFDKNNRIWVTNNTRQGTPNSGTFCVVLNSDGSPADFSPLFGGGLLGGGFGICTNRKKDMIYLGNYGWGPIQCNPQEGSISAFDCNGNIYSPSNGFANKINRAQGMKMDSKGNLWICSWGTQDPLAPSPDTVFHYKSGNSGVVCYLGGDPDKAISYEFDNPYYGTFDLIIDRDDNVFVANSGHKKKPPLKKEVRSSVYKFRLVRDTIIAVAQWESDKIVKHPSKRPGGKTTITVGLESFRQIALNQKGEVFVGAISSNRILKFDNDLNFIEDYTNQIDAPWGVTIDGEGTIYSGNFRREEGVKPKRRIKDRPFGVTLIKDDDERKVFFMDVPTGGEEVKLANGLPIYGNEKMSGQKRGERGGPCYEPLMRMTATRIDAAGNLWAVNNWKPLLYADMNQNPGGDGLIAFIGVAVPE